MASKELAALRKSLEEVWVGPPTTTKYGLGYREPDQVETSLKEAHNAMILSSQQALARIGGLAVAARTAQSPKPRPLLTTD